MTVGPKGQVVIPKPFRDEFNLAPGDEVVVSNGQKTLILQKKSEQIEKIRAEIVEFVKKNGRKTYKPNDIDKIYEEELLEDMKRWKTP